MTVQELIDQEIFEVLNLGDTLEKVITKPFCCDLLSVAMSKAPAEAVWVTVMGNVNTLAVATLTDIACIILAEGVLLDNQTLKKAKEQKITVLASKDSIFETSLKVHQLMHA